MKKIIICCFVLLACSSCINKYQDYIASQNILNDTVMENVLIDMYLLEFSIQECLNTRDTDSLDIWTVQQMNQILEKHNTDYAQFQQSYLYYINNKKRSETLMNNVTNKVIQLEAETLVKVNTEEKVEIKLEPENKKVVTNKIEKLNK